MRIYLFVVWTILFATPEKKGELILDVQNIESADGILHVAIFDKSNFLQEGKELLKKTILVQKIKNQRLTIPNLPFGTYAVAIYHDVNKNGKFDKNVFGIPVEPYAFSNNPKVKWRSPTFDETQIELDTPQKDLQLELKRWKKH